MHPNLRLSRSSWPVSDGEKAPYCRGFLRVGDPGLEPGTYSLSENLRAADGRLRRPRSREIPANWGSRECVTRLETTRRAELVAPSWPHSGGSERGRRMIRLRTSHRRYGQTRTLRRRAAASLRYRVHRGESRCVVELVDHVAVGVQREPGTVTELARDIVNGAPFVQQ